MVLNQSMNVLGGAGSMVSKCIIALDFPNQIIVNEFLKRFESEKLYLKVGMELYYSEGPSLLYSLKEKGHNIFLDLKLHDIPNTVKSAMKQIASLDVDMVNVHASGGKRMMSAAVEGLEIGAKSKQRPLCVAVTQLTSTSQETLKNDILIDYSLEDAILKYASFAKESGLDGVVCSALEVPFLNKHLGLDFITVTPGIRTKNSDVNDQVRVVSPGEAKVLGSTYIVVGRNITHAKDPLLTYENIVKEWQGI
jgi:orotidine-5'-phosphate decarboxylase